jgi:uncharacterized membrane protein required for colicin V production
MISDILAQLNWVDLLIIIVFVRILCMAVASGFPLEIFKLLGTFSGLYLSLHYFTFFTDWMSRGSPSARKAPLQFLDFFSLILLAAIGYLIFVALRLVFDKFVKMEVTSALNRGVALVLGSLRAVLLASLITFALAVSSIGYLKESVEGSFLGKRFLNTAVNTYTWTWGHATSKFSLGEKFNATVPEVQKQIEP